MRAQPLLLFAAILLVGSPLVEAGSVYFERTPEVTPLKHYKQLVRDTIEGDTQVFMEISCFDNAIARAIVITGGLVGFVECSTGLASNAVVPATDGPFIGIVMGEGTGVLQGSGAFHIRIRSR
ncbi:MAG TPA: hypothetical protein VM370_06245 [Candidatus Thermoplasmatota archaeon]|nr:hypothetical protein [Candidatus Thermoplasmatota archaeon]